MGAILVVVPGNGGSFPALTGSDPVDSRDKARAAAQSGIDQLVVLLSHAVGRPERAEATGSKASRAIKGTGPMVVPNN